MVERCVAPSCLLFGELSLGKWFLKGPFTGSCLGLAKASLTQLENAGLIEKIPAAAPFLAPGLHFLAGVNQGNSSLKYQDLNEELSFAIKESPVMGGHAFALWNGQLKDFPLSFGVGQYFPYHSKMEWEPNWSGKHILTKETLLVGVTTSSLSIKVAPMLALGLSLDAVGASFSLERRLNLSAQNEIPLQMGLVGQSFGGSGSLFVHLDKFSYGLSYKSEVTIPLKGKILYDTSQVPAFTASFPDGEITSNLKLPDILSFGFAYRMGSEGERPWFEFSIDQVNWSRFNELKLKFKEELLATEQVEITEWKDALSFRVGATVPAFNYYKFRAGVAYTEGPVRAKYLDPMMPDLEGRYELGCGLGINYHSFFLDISYLIVKLIPSETNKNPLLTGKYEGGGDLLTGSFGFRW